MEILFTSSVSTVSLATLLTCSTSWRGTCARLTILFRSVHATTFLFNVVMIRDSLSTTLLSETVKVSLGFSALRSLMIFVIAGHHYIFLESQNYNQVAPPSPIAVQYA